MKAEIRKLLGTDKLIIGQDRTFKLLRSGGISRVLLSSNCSAEVKATAEHYAEQASAEVMVLDVPNEELGVYCKKPFNIQVLGIRV